MDLIDECARAMCKMGDDWKPYKYECLPKGDGETKIVRISGMVAPPLKRGKRKGFPNWSKGDKSTEREVYITIPEHAEFVRQWEARTGLCSTCQGTTQQWVGWSVKEGPRYDTCRKCKGTGKSLISDNSELIPSK